MFVGDSLSLNQWQSLTCMLHKAVPKAAYSLKRSQGLSTFSFPVSLPLSLILHFNFLINRHNLFGVSYFYFIANHVTTNQCTQTNKFENRCE